MEKDKELEKTIDSINKGIEDMKEGLSKKADVETLEQKYTELTEKLNSVVGTEDFKKQQDHLDQISTDLKKLGEQQGPVTKSYKQVIEETLKSDETIKRIKSASGKGSGQIFAFETKAITTGDINSGDIRTQYEPGVAKAPWMQNPLWDSIPKGAIGDGRDSVSWWEETTRTDSASMLGETDDLGSETQAAATWTKQSIDITHIGAHLKVSRSSLEDWEYTRSEVIDLIENQLPRKIESQLISATGTGNTLNGLINQAKSFSKPANFEAVEGPNYIDATRAIATQIMNGDTSDANKRGFMPNLLFVNQGDLQNLRGMKDLNNGYIIPPLGGGVTNIDGIRIVPSLDLASGQFLMCDMSKAKAYIKRNMQISFHYENEDDALNDLVLIMTRMRMAAAKIPTPHKFAFVTGTWDAVKASIEKVTG